MNIDNHAVELSTRSKLLLGAPVVRDVERWCTRHNRRREGIYPKLAVVYFDTGDDAKEYLHIKAEVAAKAGIGYATYKLLPDASTEEVAERINALNDDSRIHGILVQRPIPKHLCGEEVMRIIRKEKHVEEYKQARISNIAVDGLRRVLDAYHQTSMLHLDIILLGGTNIITPGFKAEMRRRFKRVDIRSRLGEEGVGCTRETVIITEMNVGGSLKPGMLGSNARMVIDLGFDVNTKMGDLDPAVHRMECITLVPTPGGVLPVLLWLMMERTIKASRQLEPREESPCLVGSMCKCVIL